MNRPTRPARKGRTPALPFAQVASLPDGEVHRRDRGWPLNVESGHLLRSNQPRTVGVKSASPEKAFVKVNGKLCYLSRAVDHEGEVLESVVTAKRDKARALKFLKRIMKTYGRPRTVVTDELCSSPAAMKEIGIADGQGVGVSGASM